MYNKRPKSVVAFLVGAALFTASFAIACNNETAKEEPVKEEVAPTPAPTPMPDSTHAGDSAMDNADTKPVKTLD